MVRSQILSISKIKIITIEEIRIILKLSEGLIWICRDQSILNPHLCNKMLEDNLKNVISREINYSQSVSTTTLGPHLRRSWMKTSRWRNQCPRSHQMGSQKKADLKLCRSRSLRLWRKKRIIIKEGKWRKNIKKIFLQGRTRIATMGQVL